MTTPTPLTQHRFFWPISILALVLIALPFLGIQSPPLADYPNHMARFHILENLAGSPELQSYYTLREGFYPYMSIATFMKVFAPLLGVETAGRAFAVLAICMPVFGSFTLSKAVHGRVSILALGMVVIALSSVAGWGFLNFLFSTGVVLMIFAAWTKTTSWPIVRRVIVFSILALMATTLHLISAAVLGLLIGFWELSAVISRRTITRKDFALLTGIACVFVPAGILILTQLGGEFSQSETVYGNLNNKISVLRSPLSMFGGQFEEFIALMFIISLIMLRLAKVIAFDSRLAFTGFCLLGFGLLLPFQLFGVAYVGIRFPLLALAVFIAGIREIDPKKCQLAFGALLVLIAAKLFVIRKTFDYANTQTAELRLAMQDLPQGVKLLPVLDSKAAVQSPLRPKHYFHQPGWIVADRDGLFPYFFAMFNVGLQPEHQAYTHIWGNPIEERIFDTERADSYARNWREDYDYVLFMDNSAKDQRHDDLTETHRGTWFSIQKITP